LCLLCLTLLNHPCQRHLNKTAWILTRKIYIFSCVSQPSFAISAAALFNSLAPATEPPPPVGQSRPLFDGKTLAGWEGNPKLWRVEAGALTGGSLSETVPQKRV